MYKEREERLERRAVSIPTNRKKTETKRQTSIGVGTA
jgi:hypothetical protein